MIDITGVYSNQQIKKALENGHIVCYPLNENHINGSSFDVTLGQHYFRVTESRIGAFVYNPWDETQVKKHFQYHKAETHAEVVERLGIEPLENIPLDCPVIHLEPGERILGHTHEFIGIKAPGTSSMQARSTTGRNGIAVCLDAGWGDPGYVNRWTMEIYNMHTEKHIILPVGSRIAQMVFYHTGAVDGEYSNLSGKYQTTSADDIDELVKNWHPRQMLPRAYKDTITTYEPLACDDINQVIKPESNIQSDRKEVIINIEGVDGSGKGTQYGLLSSRLKENGVNVTTFDFPQYGTSGAKLVEEFQNGKLPDLTPHQIAQFYAVDRLTAKSSINSALSAGSLVLFNRFIPSNIAYQAARFSSKEEQDSVIDFIEKLEYGTNGLPRPTLNIITAIDYKLSQQNVDKKGERGYTVGRDINESDEDLQRRVSLMYDRLCEERDDYVRIECMGTNGKMLTRDEIHEIIWKHIEPLLG